MDNEEIQSTELDNAGVDAPKPVANAEPDIVPAPADTTTSDSSTTDVKAVVAASIDRKSNETIKVDENFNFTYTLRNGKTLKTSVAKPSLSISTQLADKEIRAANEDDGEQIIILNYFGVYKMIMEKLIKVVLVDDAPMHSATYDHFTEIGMTKAELDDYMNIINTFYLS